MQRRIVWIASVLILVLAGAATCAYAADEPFPDAASVVAKYNARDQGEHVRRVLMITQRNRRGRERVRQALSCRKYYGTEKRTAFFFLSPASVAGTGFLTYDYADPNKEDVQWLYLPSVRKVRRINAGDRGDFFVGTDFTYEDMKKESKLSAEEFSFELIGTESVDGHRCFKVEATPSTKRIAQELGYAKAVYWFDVEILIAHKTQFLDADGAVIRTILKSDIAQIDGIWTAQRVVAKNERSGHSTEFRFSEIDYEAPVEDWMFTRETLVRGPRRH